MTETVVHVSTLKQWNAVLDVWFKRGYKWYSGEKEYHGEYFKAGGIRELLLNKDNDILVPTPGKREQISYKEFMAQQKEDNKMETYYVTQEQFDLINDLKFSSLPFYNLVHSTTDEVKDLAKKIPDELDSKILRYIGGDETIEFKVTEQLYRLWRIDNADDKVYMRLNSYGTPDSTMYKYDSFTAPIDEIKKWQTPAWKIEEVN